MANELAKALIRHMARTGLIERADIIAISDDLKRGGHFAEAQAADMAFIEAFVSPALCAHPDIRLVPDGGNDAA